MAYKTLSERMAEIQTRRAQVESGLPPMAPIDSNTTQLHGPGRPGRTVVPTQVSAWARVANAPVIKQTLGTLSYAATELEERGAEFRGALSLIAPGGIPMTRENIKKAAKFNLELTGQEFLTQALGQEFAQEMEAIGFLEYEALNPWTNVREKRYRFNMLDALSIATEVAVDPFNLVAALPKSAIAVPLRLLARQKLVAGGVSTVKAAGALAREGIDAVPFLARILSPRASWGRFAPEMADELEYAGARIHEAYMSNHTQVQDLMGKHGVGRIAGAWKRGEIRPHVIWAKLSYGGSRSSLRPAELAIMKEIDGVLEKAFVRLSENGDTVMKFRKKTPHGTITKEVRFDPKKGLSQFRPYVRGLRQRPIDAQKAIADISVRNAKHLPFKNIFEPDDVLKNIKNIPKANRDPAYALERFLNDVTDRVIWHEKEYVAPLAKSLKSAQKAGKALRPRVIKKGFLERFKLISDDYGAKGQSAAVARLSRGAFLNFKDKVHQITGHARDRYHIANNATLEAFFYHLAQVPGMQDANKRWNRITDALLLRRGKPVPRDFYLDGNAVPFFAIPQVDLAANTMVKNLMIAALGGNLGSAVKNTSQLLNTASVEGIGPTLRGLYRAAARGHTGATDHVYAQMMNKVGISPLTTIKMVDDMTIQLMSKMENFIMGPFNVTEYMARGASFTIAADREVLKIFGTAAKAEAAFAKKGLMALTKAQQRQVMMKAVLASNRFNFIYGIAGRSQFLQTPLFKVGLALQSYSWKYAGFVGGLLKNDPSALVRLLAMHGAAIEMMHKYAGINAENWLGWGFLGGMPMASGPFVDLLNNLQSGLTGWGAGDLKGTEAAMRDANIAADAIHNLPGFKHLPEMVGMAGYFAGMSGALPFPVVGLAKLGRSYDYFVNGEKRDMQGGLVRPITPMEAINSLAFTLSADVERNALAQLDRKNTDNYNTIVNARITRYLEALKGNDRDEVIRRGRELFDYVPVTVQNIAANSGPGKLIANFAAQKGGIRPHPLSIMGRIKRRLMAQKAPRAVREMLDGGFIDQVTKGLWSQMALEDLERQMDKE